MGEEVLGSFVIETIPIFTVNIPYRLFLTSDRFVAVKFESVEEALIVIAGRDVAKTPPAITIRQGKKIPGLAEKDGKLIVVPHTVLAADTDNFELPYSHITRIEMKKGGFSGSHWTRAGKMVISTPQNKQRLEISKGQIFEDCLIVVHSVLPDNLKNQLKLYTVRYCPVCHDEFQGWVEVCPDCGAKLVKELPAQSSLLKREKTDEPLVHIVTAPNEAIAYMWSEILEEHDIYCLVKRGLAAAMYASSVLGCEMHVLASQVEKAREILASLTDNQHKV
ncbi:putative signal transducing protein [Chloroflexota bacterium]